MSRFDAAQVEELTAELRQRFGVYRTSNLKSVSAGEFADYIQSRIGMVDSASEGYSEDELDRQRDLSIKFHWGHDHDFGDFRLEGRMGERHIRMLADLLSWSPVKLEDFDDKDVFDIGCWTGGTSLLLAALGSRVFAIEEVGKYADMAAWLARAFGVDDRIGVERRSIYACNSEAFYDRFDMVYFPGVIYHLSDPLIALRILFNSLKAGGVLLLESGGIDSEEPVCRFDGSQIHLQGTREALDRGGWNWFLPSASALARMMREAGFEQVDTVLRDGSSRIYGYGKKLSQTGICRAGLSIPDIR
jgi:SAM-dependent methyltransferase